MARVLISAAHTLKNPGEVFRDLREADITRNIVKKVLPYLEKKNIEFQAVPLDLDLMQRIEWINATGYTEENGDIFIEIHVNDGGKRGVEGWFKGNPAPDNKSQKLTETIVENICKINGFEKQGVRSEYEHELGTLLILNQTKTISTAVECLYIDNEEDIKIIKDENKLDKLAESIAESINIYITTNKSTVTSVTSTTTATQSNITPVPPTPFQGNTTAPGGFPSFGGGFNKGMGLGGFGGGMGGNQPLGNKSSSMMMDREERKSMITKVYQKILGKDPIPNDLNTHLNAGVTEEQLTQKLLESKDYEEMKENAKQYNELKSQKQKIEGDVEVLKTRIKDLERILANLNNLLGHKNQTIESLRRELVKHNIIGEGQVLGSLYSNNNPNTTPPRMPQSNRPTTNKKSRRRFF
jgi:hypothetical protein